MNTAERELLNKSTLKLHSGIIRLGDLLDSAYKELTSAPKQQCDIPILTLSNFIKDTNKAQMYMQLSSKMQGFLSPASVSYKSLLAALFREFGALMDDIDYLLLVFSIGYIVQVDTPLAGYAYVGLIENLIDVNKSATDTPVTEADVYNAFTRTVDAAFKEAKELPSINLEQRTRLNLFAPIIDIASSVYNVARLTGKAPKTPYSGIITTEVPHI